MASAIHGKSASNLDDFCCQRTSAKLTRQTNLHSFGHNHLIHHLPTFHPNNVSGPMNSADDHRWTSSYPPLPPSILCFGIFLTLFVCSPPQNVQSANPEASTYSYSVQLNANLGSSQNGNFFNIANLSVSVTNSPSNSGTTSNKPSSTTTPKMATTTLAAKSPSIPAGIDLKYAIAFPVNILCIFFQIYVSIFGRRMEMSGIRWFTIYYNIWNIYQIVVISNTVENNNPWQGWLNDSQIVANKESLELFTMSFFPLGVILLVPLILLSHFCFCCPLRWIPWLLIFFLLSILPTFLYNGGFFNFNLPLVKGNLTLNWNGTNVDLLQAYSFCAICYAILSLYYLIPMVFMATFFFLCYRLLNRFNPKSNHPLRASRMLDLFLLLPYLLVILAVHAPCFIINLSGFFISNIYPTLSTTLIPFLMGIGAPNSAASNSTTIPPPAATSNWMMNVLKIYNQISMYKDDSLMFLPMIEFLASILFIRIYREQYFGLLSCYACYKDERDGAFGICCKKRRPLAAMMPVVHPTAQNPQLWAQPVWKK